MTDRARLTEEQVEEIRRHGYSRALWSHELDALCDHALADLRRESAACPAPSAGAVPDGGLSREIDELIEEIPAIRNYYKGCTFTTATKDINRLCDAVMALRSLERPAGRVVPEEPTYEMMKALAGEPLILAASEFLELQARYKAMLAAAPPAKHQSGGAR